MEYFGPQPDDLASATQDAALYVERTLPENVDHYRISPLDVGCWLSPQWALGWGAPDLPAARHSAQALRAAQ